MDSTPQSAANDSSDMEYDPTTPPAAPHNRPTRPSTKGRKLTRWDIGIDQHVLLALQYILSQDGIAVDWDKVGKIVSDHMSGESIKQHLIIVRKARTHYGQDIPPPLKNSVRKETSIGNISDQEAKRLASLIYQKPQPEKKSKRKREEDNMDKGASNVRPPPKKRASNFQNNTVDSTYTLRTQAAVDYNEASMAATVPDAEEEESQVDGSEGLEEQIQQTTMDGEVKEESQASTMFGGDQQAMSMENESTFTRQVPDMITEYNGLPSYSAAQPSPAPQNSFAPTTALAPPTSFAPQPSFAGERSFMPTMEFFGSGWEMQNDDLEEMLNQDIKRYPAQSWYE